MKKVMKKLSVTMWIVVASMLIMGISTFAAAKTITPTVLKTPTSSTSGVKSTSYEIPANTYGGITIPVRISQAGEVTLSIKLTTTATVNTVLSDSADMGKKEDVQIADITKGSKTVSMSVTAKKACIKYIYIYADTKDIDKKISASIKAYQYKISSNATLTAGKWVTGYVPDFQSVYYKIKVPANGTITVSRKLGEPSITLCNSKKKSIGDADSYRKLDAKTSKTYIALKKGTYYLKLENDSAYKIRYTFKAIKNCKYSNTTQAKAITLNKGSTVNSAVTMSKKNTIRWFKIKLTKKQKIKVVFKQTADKGTYLYFNMFKGNKDVPAQFESSGKIFSSVGKVAKGTYYIMVHAGKGRTASFSLKLQ